MKYFIANWKSNKSRAEVTRWLTDWRQTQIAERTSAIILCPAYPALELVAVGISEYSQAKQIYLGVQDISAYPAGSYTGAVSDHNLEGLEVKYAIVGHSERRRYFGETDQQVANKVERCIESEITPIVCVDDDYIASQAFAIKKEYLSKCLVAYEALSAIGSGQSTPVRKVEKIFAQVKDEFGQVKTIYGGSVTAHNVVEYLTICDGVLVGGASLKVKEFAALINQ